MHLPLPLAAERLLPGLSATIATRLDELRRLATAIDPAAVALVDQCATLLQGGKRFRAALAYWAFRANGGAAAAPAALQLGAALELFQASALFHDDLLDNSDTRRGAPTAHRAFQQRHLNANLAGDSAQFGENAAILLGDIALSLAYAELNLAITTGGLSPGQGAALQHVFATMCQEVFIGQYLDILLENEPLDAEVHGSIHASTRAEIHAKTHSETQAKRAETVLQAKSASYSVKYPLILGAILAGAPDSLQGDLVQIGERLGAAYQLRDDLLGIFGDMQRTGKPAGDDLREGKRTLLLLSALQNASQLERVTLIPLIGKQNLTTTELAQAREILVNTGAVAEIESKIASATQDAITGLEGLPLAEPGKAMLVQLAQILVNRDS